MLCCAELTADAQFITLHGNAFTEQALVKWWKDFETIYRAPYGHMSMRDLRSVFITHRCDEPGIPGPSNAAAAQQMGNTEAQWLATYYNDGSKRRKLADENAHGVNEYRKAVLKSGARTELML